MAFAPAKFAQEWQAGWNAQGHGSQAPGRQPDLRFHLRDAFQGHDTLVFTYENHRGVLAAETLSFTVEGLVWQASACHAGE